MLNTMTALAFAALAIRPAASGLADLARSARHADPPGIRVWLSGDELVQRGERVRIYYRTERDAYVTIFRVDTDGRVRVLFPAGPGDDNYVYGGATYAVTPYNRGESFVVDDYPGVGYVFAVASADPFDYHSIAGDQDHWDVRLAAEGRIHGDPRTTMEELVQGLLPADYADFDTHLVPYYVERRYDYPRFVCYDCHHYVPYYAWDPYYSWCSRFTLVLYRDPFYFYPTYWYPTRYYGGTRVVYVAPGSRVGTTRYVFKTRDAAAPGVDYRDRRRELAAGGGGRPDERFVTGNDVGGVGTIPAPGRRVTEAPRRSPADAPPQAGDVTRQREAVPGEDAGQQPRRRAPGIEIVPGPTSQPRGEAPGRRGSGRDSYITPPPDRGDAGRQPPARENMDRGPERPVEPRPEPSRRASPEFVPRQRDEAPRTVPWREAQPPQRSEPRAAPESRPAPSPSSRPESRPAPQARERESGSSRQASPRSPGLERRRPN